MKCIRVFLTGLLLLLSAHLLKAQVTPAPAAKDSSKPLDIIHADRLSFLKKDSTTEMQMLVGHVRMRQGTTLVDCDSAIFNKKLNTLEAFGNVHINDNDSVQTFSDYIIYYATTKTALLQKKVVLTDGKGRLETDELEYDLNSKLGKYTKGGKVLNGKSTLTSKQGFYYGDTKDVYFMDKVVMVDPQYSVATDTLLYNINTDITTFVAPTTINDGSSIIRTSSGYYNNRTGESYFGQRPVIKDSVQTIVADSISFDKRSGEGYAKGKLVYKNEQDGIVLLSEEGRFNREKKTFLGTQKPVVIFKQDQDSVYLSADTIYSGVSADTANQEGMLKDSTKTIDLKSKGSDTVRYFQGFHHVRIFSDSLQGVADSMYYSYKDSVFRFVGNPIMWANNSQITGDTMWLYTKNKKPDRLYVHENAFSVNKTKEGFNNQLRGNSINAYFKNGEIQYMRARGSAESVYFLQDEDSAYVGANYAHADAISIYFENKELIRVSWVNQVEGNFYPVRKVPEERKTLRGFKWLDEKRPKNKAELFR